MGLIDQLQAGYGNDEWFNPLKPEVVCIIFKNSVRTSQRTPHLTITNRNWLTLFKEVIAVYSENHTKPINTKYGFKD
jgi:hypothetical protein